MPAETTPADESDDPETTTITTETEYEIEQEAITELTQDVAVHAVVGGSEFEQALVASNPDSDEEGDPIAFGYRRDELDILPAARHTDDQPENPRRSPSPPTPN